jgi:hypothetical protein
MNVLASSVPLGSFGPFFGVEAYDDPGMSAMLLGSLGVDAATGEILYLDPTFGFTAVPSVTVPFGTWHSFELLLDFGSDEYSIFYDGALQVSGIDFFSGPSNNFSDAPIATVAAGADMTSQGAIGTGFFDNYVITAIPEPTPVIVWSLLTSVAVVNNWVRRRRPT